MNKYLIVITFVIAGCTSAKHPAAVKVSLVNKGQSIQLKGLDYVVMQDIARDTNKDIWQSLAPVYRMPADTGMKSYQPLQPGRYQIKDSSIVFTPDTPFIKGQTYFVRNYRLGEGAALIDYIKSRSQPGKVHFIDLIFKR
jgi:hypothetical protein